MPESTAGVAVPLSWAGEVAHFLWSHGNLGPVLTLPALPRRWVFLADPGDRENAPAPYGVDYLTGPLPATLRWIVRPGVPPRLDAVLCAIRVSRPR